MSICLSMIVKDEINVIKRCIYSVKDIISYWVIVDTGSTDGTQTYIKTMMRELGIPGELHEREWVDFATNRNQAHELSLGKAQYTLSMDADDVLVITSPTFFQNLNKDEYFIYSFLHDCKYTRKHIVSQKKKWKWVGILHEKLVHCCEVSEYDIKTETIPTSDAYIIASTSRFKKGNTIEMEIETLKKCIEKHRGDPLEEHYTSYLVKNLSKKDKKDALTLIDTYNWDTYKNEMELCKFLILKNMGEKYNTLFTMIMELWEENVEDVNIFVSLLNFLYDNKRYILTYLLGKTGEKYIKKDEINLWKVWDVLSCVSEMLCKDDEALEYLKKIKKSSEFKCLPKEYRDKTIEKIG